MNPDKEKYGSIIKELHSQRALGNDQYSKTLVDVNNVLSTHRFDNVKEIMNRNKSNNDEDSKIKEGKTKDETFALSFAQLEGKY